MVSQTGENAAAWQKGMVRIMANLTKTGQDGLIVDRTVLYSLSYGVYAIGVTDSGHGRAAGCIVNTVTQVTSEPARISVAVNYDNYTCALINRTGRFTVSILSENVDPAVITNLGFRSGRDTDKFTGFAARATAGGLPIVAEGCSGYLTCSVRSTLDAGTHCLILADVVEAFQSGGKSAPPMSYAYYHDVIRGRAPKNAPTYRGEEQPAPPVGGAEASAQPRWRCSVCGYEYGGDLTQEPDSYVCPICGAKKERFMKIA